MYHSEFLSTCLVCNSLHKTSVSDNQNLLVSKKKVFDSCSKYLKVETEEITDKLRWDFTKDPLPYCASCFLSAHKVSALDDQIEAFKLEIDCIIQEFIASIHKSHESEIKCIEQSNTEEDAKAAVPRCNLVQKKISHYRNLVVNGLQKKTPLPGVTYAAVGSEHEIEIKHEPLFDCTDYLGSFSPLGSHLDEPDSPFSVTNEQKTSNGDGKIFGSKKRQHAKSSMSCEKKQKSTENLPKSVQRLMETYGMHTRKLVLQLHRICRDKSGRWSVIKEETLNNRQPLQSRKGKRRKPYAKRTKEYIKTMVAEDGKGICAGVLMKPTPDGQQQCGDCNKIYKDRGKLARHIKTFHAGRRQKRYYQPKQTTKFFKFVETPDGLIYAGVKLIEQSNGRMQCGRCERICKSKQSVATHIRWYHLGKDVAQAYKKRREAYQIKRKAVLGVKVPKKELLKAKEMLKNKDFLLGVIHPSNVAELNSNSVSSNVTSKSSKTTVKTSKSTSSSMKIEKNDTISNKVVYKDDASDSEGDNDQILDDATNDSDFSPDERTRSSDANDPDFEEYENSGSESYATAEESDTEDVTSENSKKNIAINYELVTQEDGQQFYGGIKIITTSENKLQCTECSTTLSDMMEMLEHLKSSHLPTKAKVNQILSFIRQRHKLTIHEDGKKYLGGIEIKEHYMQNGKQICGKCKKIFSSISLVIRHIQREHLGISVQKTYNARRLKLIKRGDRKQSYGGIEIESLEDGKCKCGFCNSVLSSILCMKRHIRESHLVENQSESLNIVEKDGKRFFGGIEVKSKEDAKEECGQCKLVCVDLNTLLRHIKSKHLGMQLKWRSAREKYEDLFFKTIDTADGNKTYAGVTILVSSDEGKYTCGKCRRSFTKLQSIRRHIRSLHAHSDIPEKEKALRNRKRNHTHFNSDGLLYAGILCKKLEDGMYQCGFHQVGDAVCGMTFPTSFTMVTHITKNHIKPKKVVITGRKINRTVTTEDGRKIYAGVEMVKMDDGNLQCGECQKVYKPKAISGLMGHIIRVHEQKEGGHYVCNVCGKNCGYKFNLNHHMLKHKDSKTYVCEICGLAYKQEASLTHHVRQVHKGIKRHTCEQCGKQYYHTRDFIIHQRRHTGEKPFQCSICGKNFYSVYEMKVHEKVHNKDKEQLSVSPQSKPRTAKEKSVSSKSNQRGKQSMKKGNDFACDYCDESFRTLAASKKHMLEEHPDSESEANDCDQGARNPSEKEDYTLPNVVHSHTGQSSAPNEFNNMPKLENMGSNAFVQSVNRIPPIAHLPAPPMLQPMYDYPGNAFQMYGHPPYHPN